MLNYSNRKKEEEKSKSN